MSGSSLLRAGAVFGTGLLLGGAALSDDVSAIVSGTAHQALFSIAVYGDTGIAVGAAGAILESADAGKTWKEAASVPTQASLLGVSAQQGHAIVVGQEGVVLVMDADGKWVKGNSGTSNRLFAVGVNADGVAAAVGAFGTVLYSRDGGFGWSSIAPDWSGYAKDGEQPHLYDVVVDRAGVITMVGEFGLILRSGDGGKSWQTLHKGDASLFALQLQDDGVGYAVGQNGTVLRSGDGGASWSALNSGTSAILLGVHSAPTGRVVVTGMHDMLRSGDDGKSWTRLGGEEISGSWYQGIAGIGGGQQLLAVGHSGQIVRIAE
ncbi:MAG: hypothetical protein P4L83_17150 [Nevskia sp.]|nr:hypothetical protein [Nevskia sp.]